MAKKWYFVFFNGDVETVEDEIDRLVSDNVMNGRGYFLNLKDAYDFRIEVLANKLQKLRDDEREMERDLAKLTSARSALS
jgi:hypothetical protein